MPVDPGTGSCVVPAFALPCFASDRPIGSATPYPGSVIWLLTCIAERKTHSLAKKTLGSTRIGSAMRCSHQLRSFLPTKWSCGLSNLSCLVAGGRWDGGWLTFFAVRWSRG